MLAQIISNVAGQFDYCTDYFPRIKKKSLIYTIFFQSVFFWVFSVFEI